jgi:hypothetical protein
MRAALHAIVPRGAIGTGFAIGAARNQGHADSRSILVRPLHATRARRLERIGIRP